MSFAQKIAYATSTPREEFVMRKLTEGLDSDTFLRLSILINHMGTCHPLHAQHKDSPFITTINIFKTHPADHMGELFLAFCLQLVQKLKAIDREVIEPGVSSQPKIDYDRLTCILNLISDLIFVPTVKAILTTEYIRDLETVLLSQYPLNNGEHKNRELAKEICTELFLKR